MSLASPEYWAILGGVLWKICTGIVFPSLALYGILYLIVWAIQKGGMSDL